MTSRRPRRFARRGDAAFSLVEIALSLGIVAFALIGIVGALPLAMGNGRASIAQSRAASVAETIFTNFRAQKFGSVQFLDDSTAPTLNLNARVTTNSSLTDNVNGPVLFYAAFDEAPSPTLTTDALRLHFLQNAPATAPVYQIILRFDNHPGGTLAPYPATPGSTALHAQANGIEASISELDRPKDVYTFDSVIANRSE